MIDRKALVRRHDPVLGRLDPFSPLSVGNGNFAFTADATGLQTFLPEGDGTTPLCTMAQWGWHSYPGRAGTAAPNGGAVSGSGRDSLRLGYFAAGGRTVGYMTDSAGQEELFRELRINPHRLNLARIGLVVTGPAQDGLPSMRVPAENIGEIAFRAPRADSVGDILQRLDLFEGCLESSFTIGGFPVRVMTVAHPDVDAVSFRIESSLLASRSLGIALSFPYGSHLPDASDWNSPELHRTVTRDAEPGKPLRIERILDGTRYHVAAAEAPAGGTIKRTGLHEFLVTGTGPALELTVLFSPEPFAGREPSWTETRNAARKHWSDFWTAGGAIELIDSADPRAKELERRIVLSRYLAAIQCAGMYPPQETGLACNSWYGKFHLEMHYWHAAHFALWGQSELLAKSLGWYRSILDGAKERARSQGYRGARWPKMTDPSGDDSPSPIGPLLCWQEPHPIMYAELLRRAGYDETFLASLTDMVFETAEFMADYARPDPASGRVILGPPLIPAQESHQPLDTLNPAFELEYWRWGLATALRWMEGKRTAPDAWKKALDGLSLPPTGTLPDGRTVYLAHERCPETFSNFAKDHPSMLLALGMLPGLSVAKPVMSATYDAVLESWDLGSCWGWDFPAMAMTAARLGRRKDAVDALLMETPKNTWRVNGHNAQLSAAESSGDASLLWTTALPLYLPGNGALLLAAGMMAAGWDGAPEGNAPGFPDDGSWTVKSEGILPMP